jgi:hypothetical protein
MSLKGPLAFLLSWAAFGALLGIAESVRSDSVKVIAMLLAFAMPLIPFWVGAALREPGGKPLSQNTAKRPAGEPGWLVITGVCLSVALYGYLSDDWVTLAVFYFTALLFAMTWHLRRRG